VIRAIHLHDNVFLLAYKYDAVVEIRDFDNPDEEIKDEDRFYLEAKDEAEDTDRLEILNN